MNFFLIMVIFSPVMLLMAFRVMLSPFGWIRLIPLLTVAILGVALFDKRRKLVGRLAVWTLLTYLFDLVAWLVSKREIADEAARLDWVGFPSLYRAGFPVH